MVIAAPDPSEAVPSNVVTSADLLRIRRELDHQRALADSVERLVGALDQRQSRLHQQLVTLEGAARVQAARSGRNALAGAPTGRAPIRDTPTADASSWGTPIKGALGESRPRIDVLCLGGFRFLLDGQSVGLWRPGKARSLLQYLVTHRHRPVSRDALIAALWPNPDAAAAATSLKVAVHALRQMLSQIEGDQPLLEITARESGYELGAPALWLDAEEFELCCTLGRQLEGWGRPAEALAFYASAAALYRGDFLEDSSGEWVLLRRESLKDQYLYVLARLAAAALEAGDYQTCIARCHELLERDRCREDAYRMLMECHERLGQRSRVRCWYHICVRTLRTELDVAPEADTEALYRRVIGGDA